MYLKNYCLITGASEGFGKALTIECAGRKMNLILVALPGPELFYLANFIERNYKVEVIVFEKDLTKEEDCTMLYKEVCERNYNINILINNAGLGNTQLFSEGSISFYEQQLKLNVVATTLLTRLFLDMLRNNTPAYILNVGSLCSFFYLAKKQVYGATKSFIYFFSKSLRRELQNENIHVSVICPGSMNTNTSVILLNKKSGWLSQLAVMNPEEVAPIAIDGLLKRKEVIIPGRVNKFFLVLNKLIPASLKKIITNNQMKLLNAVPPRFQPAMTETLLPVSIPANKPLPVIINQIC